MKYKNSTVKIVSTQHGNYLSSQTRCPWQPGYTTHNNWCQHFAAVWLDSNQRSGHPSRGISSGWSHLQALIGTCLAIFMVTSITSQRCYYCERRGIFHSRASLMGTCHASRRQDDTITCLSNWVPRLLLCDHLHPELSLASLIPLSHIKPDWKTNSCGSNLNTDVCFPTGLRGVWWGCCPHGHEYCCGREGGYEISEVFQICSVVCFHETCRKSTVLWLCQVWLELAKGVKSNTREKWGRNNTHIHTQCSYVPHCIRKVG